MRLITLMKFSNLIKTTLKHYLILGLFIKNYFNIKNHCKYILKCNLFVILKVYFFIILEQYIIK